MELSEETQGKVVRALRVLTLDARIVTWLNGNDPQALKQAKEALRSVDRECSGGVA